MKTKELYICEVCGAEYEYKVIAELCESLSIEKQIFKSGDQVECKTRYDGWKPAKVVETEIYTPFTGPFSGWGDNIDGLKERLKSLKNVQHKIYYIIDREHQQGKETWTKYWTEDLLRLIKII